MQNLVHWLHKQFLIILFLAYVLAYFLPQPGQWLHHLSFGSFALSDNNSMSFTLSLGMLSLLLFNAGLGIKTQELFGMLSKPSLLVAGFLSNLLLPLLFILLLKGLFGLWHDKEELQNFLVGLALIAAMPIAGSSTAWSQNSNGNLSLSLGLVFFSTVLSPLTTPMVLHVFGGLTTGDYSADLHELARQGTHLFMLITVVIPSLLGIVTHFAMGDKQVERLRPTLKLVNLIMLLLLNYSNAATSLPQSLQYPDWDFLIFMLGMTLALCLIAFSVGWLLAWIFRTGESEKASLMFGLGMNNNGTGLVLAGMTLADHPAVMLPMIFYTLTQQVIAAVVDQRVFKSID